MKYFNYLLILYAASLAVCASAQEVALPTDEQVAKALKDSGEILKRLDPDYKGLDKASPGSRMPLTVPHSPAGTESITLRDLMRKPVAAAPGQHQRNAVDLMVFVSLAMPEDTLKRLASQAERAGASLVLRGLKNESMKDTAVAVRAISEKAAWQINPPAFARFDIKTVPAFVLARSARPEAGNPSESCAPLDSFVSVTGDVSLDFALETIERGNRAFGGEATGYLRKMKGAR